MKIHLPSKKILTVLIIVLVCLIVAACGHLSSWFIEATSQVTKQQPGLYSIDHFIDGDTIAIKMNGKVESIRFIGVDTPETHKPDTPVQCYGPEAAAYTQHLIGKQQVRLEADPTNQNRDRYGRLLRYIYLPDGRLISQQLIQNGYGFAYIDFPFTKKDVFVETQQQAQDNKKGLWGSCHPYQESNGRWQTNNADNAS